MEKFSLPEVWEKVISRVDVSGGLAAVLAPKKISKPKELNKKIKKETEDIKRKSIENGTYLKVPNGEPTNLTEEQWLIVRTSNFKKWFGDWENIPGESSKILDKNGEPLVLYHGKYTSKSRFHNWKRGPMYFTDSRELAEKYSKEGLVYEVFLNVKNPTAFNFRNTCVYSVDRYYDKLLKVKGHSKMSKEQFREEFSESRVLGFPGGYKPDCLNKGDYVITNETLAQLTKYILGSDGMIYFNIEDIGRVENVPEGFNIEEINHEEYDLYDYGDPRSFSNQVLVFDQNQIKSANGNIGTFKGKDIYK